jgi:hypothetical protein
MTKLTYITIVVVLSLVLSGATCQAPVVPVIIEPGDTAMCPAACERLRVLGCPEGQPLEDGTTCENFCIKTQENGQPLNPVCVTTITVCSELDWCTRAR